MSGDLLFLAGGAAFCALLFFNGRWWVRRTTMPFADRQFWQARPALVALQLRHAQLVGRIRMILAPVLFLVVTAIVLNHTFKFA